MFFVLHIGRPLHVGLNWNGNYPLKNINKKKVSVKCEMDYFLCFCVQNLFPHITVILLPKCYYIKGPCTSFFLWLFIQYNKSRASFKEMIWNHNVSITTAVRQVKCVILSIPVLDRASVITLFSAGSFYCFMAGKPRSPWRRVFKGFGPAQRRLPNNILLVSWRWWVRKVVFVHTN